MRRLQSRGSTNPRSNHDGPSDPAEADALMELLDDKVTESVDRAYSDELREAIRKLRALAELHAFIPATTPDSAAES